MPTDPVKVDISYKKFSKREYTSTHKKWHEEFPGKPLTIKSSDIWADPIPQTPPSLDTVSVKIINHLQLTQDVTVDNQLSWLACTTHGDLNTRAGDFIQPDQSLLQGYNIRLFDNNGTRIYVGDSTNWEFDYANGVLTFENTPSAYTPPFSISGYQYIGRKGAGGAGSAGTLDEAYDGPTDMGSGRIINVDFGPVKLSASNNYAPLQLDPINYTPSIGVEPGQICLKNGIVYVYDDLRTKWISMHRQTIVFGAKRADGRFLNLSDFSSSMAGWPALRDGTILGITAQASSGCSTKLFRILKNNTTLPLYTFSLNSFYFASGTLDVDFSANDLIKILASSQNPTANNVIVSMEVGWRIV